MPAGNPAPRLGEVDLSAETAREYHAFLIQQIVRMLSIGLIHGDLSEFNVLVGPEGPVIIDLPQAVNAAGNNGALAMLERDVNNIRGTLGRFAPELLETEYALRDVGAVRAGRADRGRRSSAASLREMRPLTDADGVLVAVEDARQDALQRELDARRVRSPWPEAGSAQQRVFFWQLLRIPDGELVPHGVFRHLVFGKRLNQLVVDQEAVHVQQLLAGGVCRLEFDCAALLRIFHGCQQPCLEQLRFVLQFFH